MSYDQLLTRVWDKQEKKMLYKRDKHYFGEPDYPGLMKFITCCDDFLICEFITGKEPGDIPALEFIPFGDRFIPMSSSGLRDKNNKLIYEGDIINIDEKYAKISGQDIKNCLVGFKEGCAMYCRTELHLALEDFDTYLWMDTRQKNCEIVGNAYENPELLIEPELLEENK